MYHGFPPFSNVERIIALKLSSEYTERPNIDEYFPELLPPYVINTECFAIISLFMVLYEWYG